MKTTKKIVQWIVFVLGWVSGCVVIGSIVAGLAALVVPSVVAGLFILIVAGAFGAVWGYCGVLLWIGLAERGWFL